MFQGQKALGFVKAATFLKVAPRSLLLTNFIQYIKGPVYKSIKSFAGFNSKQVLTFAPDLVIWGGAAGAGVAVFTSGVPIFKDTFYSKIPYFGSYFTYNPDPEDIPI